MQGWQIHATFHTTTLEGAKYKPKVMRKGTPTLLPRLCNVCLDMMDALRLCGEASSIVMLLRKTATEWSNGRLRSSVSYRCLWPASTSKDQGLPGSKSGFVVTGDWRYAPTPHPSLILWVYLFVACRMSCLLRRSFDTPHVWDTQLAASSTSYQY
jgi:hypothetical protein